MRDVYVTITVDWDGDYGYTIASIKKVRELFNLKRGKYHNIPLTHFITPVYFTRPNKAVERLYVTEIKKLISETNCEIGLHIHCWESLIRSLGIRYIEATPSFSWDTSENGKGQFDPVLDPMGKDTGRVLEYGHSIPLWFYSPFNIRRILDLSRKLLSKKIGKSPTDIKGFRGGGWMTSDEVLKALIYLGFEYDASAMDIGFCNINTSGTLNKMEEYLGKLWGSDLHIAIPPKNSLFHRAYPKGIPSIKKAQPKKILYKEQSILEIPDTGLLADYVSCKQMKNHINDALLLAKTQDIAVSIGFHIDTAMDHIKKIGHVIEDFATQTRVKFVTCSDVHARF